MANKEMRILSIEGEDFEIVDDKAREQCKDIAYELGKDEQGNFIALQTVEQTIIGAINELKNSQGSGGLDLSSLTITTETATNGTKLILTDGTTTKEVTIPSATETQIKTVIQGLIEDGTLSNITLGDNSVATNNLQDNSVTIEKLSNDIIEINNYDSNISDVTNEYCEVLTGYLFNTSLEENSSYTCKKFDLSQLEDGQTIVLKGAYIYRKLVDVDGNVSNATNACFTKSNYILYASANTSKVNLASEYIFNSYVNKHIKNNLIQDNNFEGFEEILIDRKLKQVDNYFYCNFTLPEGIYCIMLKNIEFQIATGTDNKINGRNFSAISAMSFITQNDIKYRIFYSDGSLELNIGLRSNTYDDVYKMLDVNNIVILKLIDKSKIISKQPIRPKIIMHRANNIYNIHEALAYGCNGIEIDIQKSSDGVFFLAHDTSQTGGVALDSTISEIKAGNPNIATLEECLQIVSKYNGIIDAHGGAINQENFEEIRNLFHLYGFRGKWFYTSNVDFDDFTQRVTLTPTESTTTNKNICISGCQGVSNVEGAKQFGVPIMVWNDTVANIVANNYVEIGCVNDYYNVYLAR